MLSTAYIWNLLRIAIFNISYIRGLFPENYFNDKSVPALGVYDALQKKYLKTLLFCVCETVEGPMIEEYAFSFSYSNSESQEVSMNVNHIGNKRQGGTFKCNLSTEITPNQMSGYGIAAQALTAVIRSHDGRGPHTSLVCRILQELDLISPDELIG
ncbi:HORMA domain-containing protein [Heracleum sosnowskyi]|uniref:HORMA domain-containing protein n=1 Tax=Heracleum sosnowskyi TaxID=360622 RepID=A0AAD8H986_9APIA|nr:HORMA domain-containing protein [Heracleum sosnowskyi]